MATAVEQYTKLKKEVDTATEQVAKAEGALEQIAASLKKEFACETLKQAKEKLKQLQKEEKDSLEKFEDDIEKFEDEWEDDDDAD